MTRPLGASVADWLAKPILGGLGIGDGPVAIALTLGIIALVGYLTLTRIDVPADEAVSSVAGAADPS